MDRRLTRGRYVDLRSLWEGHPPLAFTSANMTLWQLAAGFATQASLSRVEPTGNAPVVPDDADHGPGPGVAGDARLQWLDMRAFVAEVDAALARQKDGFSSLQSGRGPGERVSTEMLARLKRSFGLSRRARTKSGSVMRSARCRPDAALPLAGSAT